MAKPSPQQKPVHVDPFPRERIGILGWIFLSVALVYALAEWFFETILSPFVENDSQPQR